MDINPKPPDRPPSHPLRKLIWLFVALIPSIVGLLSAPKFTELNGIPTRLIVVNLVLSAIGAVGLLWREEDAYGQIVFGLFLTSFFFVLNAIVVIASGCSSHRLF